MNISGILNVDKPAGWTSFDVINFVRRRSGVKRVGHAGTLDPAATGVLPLLLGQATRLTEYLVDTTKTYEATVELGVETDTYDAEGEVVSRMNAGRVTLAAVEDALLAFVGDIDQVPPIYSAIKRDGQPLYKAARSGQTIELQPRRVVVNQLDIIAYDAPYLRLRIDCGKGFYVRSLAHDLGQALGVGGTLAGLVRTRVGSFRIQDAVNLPSLTADLERGDWQRHLYAPDEVLLSWQAAILGEEGSRRLVQGQAVAISGASQLERCRAYSAAGDFLAVLRRAGASEWRPEKVFNVSEA